MFLPRSKTLRELSAGDECDVLLCQPPLTMRIPYEAQDPVVVDYFETMANAGTGLRGDDPFEPNNGLLQMAANLRAGGLRVALLDLNLLDLVMRRQQGTLLTEQDIETVLGRFKYRILGVSVMCIGSAAAGFIAAASKRHIPDAKVVAGGLLPSALPDQFLALYPGIDFAVVGDGTSQFFDLLGVPAAARPQEIVPRAFDLLPRDTSVIPRVFTTYGCPARCTFCSPVRMSHPALFRTDDPILQSQILLEEIAALETVYGTDFFVMGDLSFLRNQPLDRLVCEGLQASAERLGFWCQMRPDDVTPASADLLRSAGCVQVAIGIEAASETPLRLSGKGYAPASTPHCRHVLDLLKQRGLSTYGYFIIGMPGERREDVERTIQLIDELLEKQLLDATHISIPVPYPGTPWYKNPERYGLRILSHEYDRYWMNCDPLGYGEPVVETRNLSSDEIYGFWLDALRVATYHYRRRTRLRQGSCDNICPVLTRAFNVFQTAI